MRVKNRFTAWILTLSLLVGAFAGATFGSAPAQAAGPDANVEEIDAINLPGLASSVALDSRRQFLYVTARYGDWVAVYDAVTFEQIEVLRGFTDPHKVAVDSETGFVYVTDRSSNPAVAGSLVVIDPVNFNLIERLDAGFDPGEVTLSKFRDELYVANSTGIKVFDTSQPAYPVETGTIEFSGGNGGITETPDGSMLYAYGSSETVVMRGIDVTTHEVMKTWNHWLVDGSETDFFDLKFNPAGTRVLTGGAGAFIVVDTEDDGVAMKNGGVHAPRGFSFDEARGIAFATSPESSAYSPGSQVFVLNAANGFELKSIPMPEPTGLVTDQELGLTFVISADEATGSQGRLRVIGVPSEVPIPTNPLDATVQAGDYATFATSAMKTPGYRVAWEMSAPGDAATIDEDRMWTPVPGATAETMVAPKTELSMNGTRYRATYKNSAGSATTASALLTVTEADVDPGTPVDPGKPVEPGKPVVPVEPEAPAKPETHKPCVEPRKVAVFADTPLSHKFYKEIDWMECMKYSTGWKQATGKPVYKPADNLERQAMAAFIYRMEAPKNYVAPKESPFADVKTTDKFYKEIAWMWTAKLSTGYKEASGKPTYRPHDSLTREAMAAFIYRLEAPKNYVAPKVSPMADMKPGMKFYKEISWMYTVKLSTGNKVGATKEYWPKDDLSRQAMAAFIYRLVTDYRTSK